MCAALGAGPLVSILSLIIIDSIWQMEYDFSHRLSRPDWYWHHND
jgi:hypothetical protein